MTPDDEDFAAYPAPLQAVTMNASVDQQFVADPSYRLRACPGVKMTLVGC